MNRAQLQNPGYRATQELAHVNHHMFIHFIKGMQVAIIPPLATPFTHSSLR